VNNIDWEFIQSLEGFELIGYVPDPSGSISGVTIASGIDLGQMSVSQLDALEIKQALKNKLAHYLGRKQWDAKMYLNSTPLKVTEAEALALDKAVKAQKLPDIMYTYNARSGGKFTDLPPAAQTVYFSVAWQYGPALPRRTPRFFNAMANHDFTRVISELRNFGDRYPTRRRKEADYLEKGLQENGVSANSTPSVDSTVSS
jgi:hypothetical protein